MKLYEISLPTHRNDRGNYEAAHKAFADIVTQKAGGVTMRPIGSGQWYSDAQGRVMYDSMVPYRVACSPEVFAEITAAAFKLFNDQEAIFTAELGLARILGRTAHMASLGTHFDLKPFELHRAERLLERAREAISPLSAALWALETAMRNVRMADGPAATAKAEEAAASTALALEALLP